MKNYGFKIILKNIIAFTDKSKQDVLSFIRIDSEASSYGFDLALRMNRQEIEKYMIVYLYNDAKHSSFVFRGVAKNIVISSKDASI